MMRYYPALQYLQKMQCILSTKRPLCFLREGVLEKQESLSIRYSTRILLKRIYDTGKSRPKDNPRGEQQATPVQGEVV